MAKQISEKSARRWMNRNKWQVAAHYNGIRPRKLGGQWHRQLVRCRWCSDDIRFRRFSL